MVAKKIFFLRRRSLLTLKALALLSLTGCTSLTPPQFSPSASQQCISINKNVEIRPTIIYQQMVQCVKDDNYQHATVLFAQAGTLTWYYSLEESTESNRTRHNSLLSASLETLSEAQKSKLALSLEETMNNSPARAVLCSKITVPKSISAGRVMPFRQDLWDKSKVGYLHCRG